MTTFTIERSGFIDCQTLVKQLFLDLGANGFIRKFPTTLSPTDTKAVFEAGPTIDTFSAGALTANPPVPAGDAVIAGAAAQPWRLMIEAPDAFHIAAACATPLQLPDTGALTYMDNGVEISGHLGKATNVTITDAANTLFYNRVGLDPTQEASSPMSYRLSITGHGVALFIWEPGNDVSGTPQSWFVIQRSVNNTNGTPRTTGKCPVVCLYGIRSFLGSGNPTTPAVNVINRFTVRETDVLRPTVSIDATNDTPDAVRVINNSTLVSITEDNNYVISFPNGINTNRFAYPVDELDIVAYTSADVVSQNSDIAITVYNESAARVYKAMAASDINNTGIRMLVLTVGG